MLVKPHDVPHTASALSELADTLKRLDGVVRMVLEHTGRYWLPIAKVLREVGLFVSTVNPKLIKDYKDNKPCQFKTERRVAADK
jgi:transposase